ncbi:xylulokinase [Pseudolysinimonas yzui]|uniref:Xylulose kinase n=1 Tax=Pseudolysinimonas yzui TaxID=2708254 RepID=A0A8J3GQ44_9MICO|nr:xylulokinase [Pseudolysinimonas yzui]GHF14270.1 xylulokinase [Pseudolysinimonas yzui]
MSLVAGVDSSTQSCKVVVVDVESGRVVRSGRAAHPEGTEVAPAAWWEALLAAIADAGGLADVEAVSIGGQQHGMVALAADGDVIRDALLWNDTRSGTAAEALRDEVGRDAYAARTGLVPVASFTASKLRWLRDAEPQNAERVAAVALPHDWLTWRLRGFGPGAAALDELTTDRSDASGTAYWSPQTGDYDRELLRLALGHDAILPRVLGPAERSGVTAAHPGVPAGIPVGVGAGDNAAAALGLGARSGDVVVSIGTSGTVFAVTDRPVIDPTGTIAGFADAGGAFLPLVATLNAAQVVDTVAALLGVDHAEFGALALTANPGADGVTLVPYFAGERTPDLPDATATFAGLTYRTTTRPNIARAAIEGMVCGLAAGLDAVVDAGVAVERILLIGGGARLEATQQIASEVFARPVTVVPPAEYVALGAAAQAAWTLTGTRPSWELEGTTVVSSPPHPQTRSAYLAAATR